MFKKDIRERLIIEHWDDLNRIAASLKDGLIRPSLLVSRLQSLQRQNPLQQALQEVGRIAKTWHILEYVDDPALRRRVLIGLNKGETLHSLARDISCGRQGRFMDRGYEAQLNRASALSLVINAIAMWNTRYLEQAHTALTGQGVVLSEDLWSHLSPFQWAHIHFNGSYRFTEVPLEEDFRPLRDYHGARVPRSALERPSQETNSEQEDANDLSPVQLAFLEEEKTSLWGFLHNPPKRCTRLHLGVQQKFVKKQAICPHIFFHLQEQLLSLALSSLWVKGGNLVSERSGLAVAIHIGVCPL